MENFVPIFLTTGITFFLFYFSVPYWTGSEFLDVSKNGIYRFVYYKLSGFGNLIYKLVEKLNEKLDALLRIRPGSPLHVIINLFLYIFIVFLFNSAFDAMMIDAVGTSDDIQLDLSTSFARFQEVALLWNIVSGFGEVNSISSFFQAFKESIGGITFFVVGTFVFYSIFFGILEQKMLELTVASKMHWEPKREDKNNDGVSDLSLHNLGVTIADNAREFLDKLAVLCNFKYLSVVFAFLLVLAGYSLVMALKGEVADFQGLVLDVLDESDILNSIGSFIIGFIYAKIVVVAGRVVYRVCPRSVQHAIDGASAAGNAAVKKIKATRDEWSFKYDTIYQKTKDKYQGTPFVNKMDLERGRGGK